MKRTKIIATLGPATSAAGQIERLIKNGVDVFRLNFSHNTFAEHEKLIGNIRRASLRAGRQPAIMQDLPGPKVRVAGLQEPCELVRNTTAVLTGRRSQSGPGCIAVNYPSIFRALKPGDPILIDDGLIRLTVLSRTDREAVCRVDVGGIVKPGKGVNFPSSTWQRPALTPADRRALAFGIRHDLDFVALSFVADEKSVLAARKVLKKNGSRAKIIAKIERPAAVAGLDGILASADGVMIARGDLAIETALEKVPFLQKDIIRRANQKNSIGIVATQMLESMTEHALPTRAEVSDVANAVLDGADALMLSAETAVGRYPVEAAGMMARIIREAEAQSGPPGGSLPGPDCNQDTVISLAAAVAAGGLMHHRILVYTVSGVAAHMLSKMRPACDIYAFTPSEKTLRQLCIEWGVRPFLTEPLEEPDMIAERLLAQLRALRLVKKMDYLIFITDTAGGRPVSDFFKIIRVGRGP